MSADVLAALVQLLKDDSAIDAYTDGRVWGVELDRAEVGNMPRKNIVVTPSGNAGSGGDASYAQISRGRFDFRCYGEDSYEAGVLGRVVWSFLKAIRPQTVQLIDGGVYVHNATVSGGPISMVDPDADWPFHWQSWGVHAAEVASDPAFAST